LFLNRILKYIIISLLIGFSVSQAFAREYGLFFSYNLNREESDVRQIGLSPDTLPAVLSGTNSGFSLGLFYDFTLSKKTSIRLLGNYTHNNAQLSNDIIGNIFFNGKDTLTTINTTINTGLSSVDFEAQLRYKLIADLIIFGGLSAGYRFSDNYDISETIKDPDIYFQNGKKTRFNGYTSTELTLKSSFIIGFAYQIYFDKFKKYSIAPEIALEYGYVKLNKDFNLDINSVKFGFSFNINPDIKYPKKKIRKLPEQENIIIEKKEIVSVDSSLIEIPKVKQENSIQKPNIKLSIHTVKNGVEKNVNKIDLKQTISSNIIPLLNYIFFDKNSAEIPNRYYQFTSETSQQFNYKQLLNLTTLEKYHHILNIIGYRMRLNPDAKIILTGCNSGDDENNDTALSQARCKSVREYLLNVWDINKSRIICKYRNLPDKFSNLDDSLSIEENRRVEITTTAQDILNLLTTNDTLISSSENSFMINIENGEKNIGKWKLTVSNNNKIVKVFSNKGKIPPQILWNPTKEEINSLDFEYPLVFSLINEDTTNYQFSVKKIVEIKVDKAVQRNASEQQKYKIENYNLILFDFDSYKLSKEHNAIIKSIISNLNNAPKIIIEGHSDIVGEQLYNKKLSYDRARSVYDSIKEMNNQVNATYLGTGYSEIFNNSLPEGRFYSRTVIIKVISEKQP